MGDEGGRKVYRPGMVCVIGPTRRTIIAGFGGAVASANLSWASGEWQEELILGHDGTRLDVLIITLTKVWSGEGSAPDKREIIAQLRWEAQSFGSTRPFGIKRRSEIGAGNPGNWEPRLWEVELPGASFPGGRIGSGSGPEGTTHTLRFRFQANQQGSWSLAMETEGWPKAGWSAWSGSGGATSVPLQEFLAKTEGWPFGLDLRRQQAQSVLSDWFGERIEASADMRLQFGPQVVWRMSSKGKAPSLHILLLPLSFSHLKVSRSVAQPMRERMEPSKSAPSPTATGVNGLVGHAEGPFTFPREAKAKDFRFELGHLGEGRERTRAELILHDPGSGKEAVAGSTGPTSNPEACWDERLSATLRQTGKPALTRAAMALEPVGASVSKPSGQDVRTDQYLTRIGQLQLTHGGAAEALEIFDIARVEVERRLDPNSRRVVTQTRLTPASKEHRIKTTFGPLDVRGLLPVSPRTGRPAEVPPILVETQDAKPVKLDRREDVVRRLVGFEARLALVSMAIRLPVRTLDSGLVDDRPGEHTTRLDFADAECRLTMPIVSRPSPAAVDAEIPIGPPVPGEDLHAKLDLTRAKLTVLRPSDLLSLKFRFSGLVLDLPQPKPGQKPARIHPGSGGACRIGGAPVEDPFASARVATAGVRRRDDLEAIPTRDERPILVVEFPPQHVAEQAYFGQRSAPELPDPRFDDMLHGLTDDETASLSARSKDGDLAARDLLALATALAPATLPARNAGADSVEKGLARLRQPRRKRGGSASDPGTSYVDRIKDRETIRDILDQAGAEGWQKSFRASFFEKTKNKLPAEQRIYVAPEFLDESARRIAFGLLRVPTARGFNDPPDVDLSPKLVVDRPGMPANIDPPSSLGFPADFDATKPEHRALSDKFEALKEAQNPAYRDFRNAYERRARFFSAEIDTAIKRNGVLGEKLEDLSIYRGTKWYGKVSRNLPKDFRDWIARTDLSGTSDEKIPNVTPSRLSGPSRLAFRINCDDFQPEHAGGGLDFTLEALTNWGSMDLAVVRRAERLFVAPERGAPPPRWGRLVNEDPAANLAFQGISRGDRLAINEDRLLKGFAPQPGVMPTGRVSPNRRLADVAAAAGKAPDPFQTAIELPFRLFLSPAQDATWLTPNDSIHRQVFGQQPVLTETVREVWSASLGGSGQSAGVRAVWSPDFRPSALLDTGAPGVPPIGPYAPWALPHGVGARSQDGADNNLPRFRTSLDSADRHELVALSSVPGLPVLGRRARDGSIVAGGSQIDPPDGYRLSGLHFDAMPNEDWKPSQTMRDLSAIYVPQVLSISELSLTALGGNLDLDTTFTPPAAAKLESKDANRALFDAFTIQRWRHRTVLGRDVLVEVVYKGFLFPIGHQATLVKVTERRFEASYAGGPPIAVLIQRLFLRTGEPVKRFPAYDHPNSGRRWPTERVTMLTRKTADLVEPVDVRGGLIELDGTVGRIFWPKTGRREDAEVRFQMQFDREAAAASLPLIFLDNRAANDPVTIQTLVDWYNGAPPQVTSKQPSPGIDKRRIQRNGQPVRMAPESKPGDTTFEVDWWILKAEGRQSAPVILAPVEKRAEEDRPPVDRTTIANRNFYLDPFMNGLDQPPFYPVCDAARCRLTSVERFTGGSSEKVWALAAFDGYYVAHGFDDDVQENALGARSTVAGEDRPPLPGGEIFLTLLDAYEGEKGQLLRMRMQSGDRSGGIGQPNLDIVGISRGTGPVGGTPYGLDKTNGAAGNSEGGVLPGPAAIASDGSVTLPSRSRYSAPPSKSKSPTLSTAGGASTPATGTSDPASLLDKARSMFPADAKLLGLVPLSEVIKIAGERLGEVPVLRESLEYGAAGFADAGAEARAFMTAQVLTPIRGALAEIDEQWRGIARQNLNLGVAGNYSLAQVYPQLGQGIETLRAAIDTAIRADSDTVFFVSLASIYEAGRSLGSAIARILQDPLASASEAQIKQLRDFLDKLKRTDPVQIIVSVFLEDLKNTAAYKFGAVASSLTDDRFVSILVAFPNFASGEAAEQVEKVVGEATREALGQIGAEVTNGQFSEALARISSLRSDIIRRIEEGAATSSSKAAILDALNQLGRDLEAKGRGIATPYLNRIAEDGARLADGIAAFVRAIKATPPSPSDILKAVRTILVSLEPLVGKLEISAKLKVSAVCDEVGKRLLPAFASLAEAAQSATPTSEDVTSCLKIGKALDDLTQVVPSGAPSAPPPIRLSRLCRKTYDLARALAELEPKLGGSTRTNVQTARIDLARAGSRLSFTLARLGQELLKVPTWKAQVWTCPSLSRATFGGVASLLKAQKEAGAALKDCLDASKQAAATLESLSDDLYDNLHDPLVAYGEWGRAFADHLELGTLIGSAVNGPRKKARDQFASLIREINSRIGDLEPIRRLADAASVDLKQLEDQAQTFGTTLQAIALTPNDKDKILAAKSSLTGIERQLNDLGGKIRDQIQNALEEAANELLSDIASSVISIALEIDRKAIGAVSPFLGAVAKALAQVKTYRDDAVQTIEAAASNTSNPLLRAILESILGPNGLSSLLIVCEKQRICTVADDRLTKEAEAFKVASTSASMVDALTTVKPVLQIWATASPAPVEIVRQISAVDAKYLKSLVVTSLIDLKALRREVESRIRNLIPARAVLNYDLDNELASFPNGLDAIFIPAEKTRLTLRSQATIHLLPEDGRIKAPDYTVVGEMGPFGIKLLGRFDVVLINFHGLSFKAGSGRSPDFSVKFKDVVIGEKAKFLEPLQKYLSPKGDGFYLKVLDGRPGLEAGYGINLGVIGCGALSFSNVTLNAAARLPFDQRGEAQFLLSIGRADAPFLISSTIFGGGGYLALIADSRKIVGFEASFDYGGVAAFGFGPLQGVGRLTTGIYLRKVGDRTTIGGTFFAGGSAHICGFGLCASLYVAMKDDGNGMRGEATFTYSFSIGIGSLDFRVRVARDEGKSLGGQSADASDILPPFVRTRYAENDTTASDGPPVALARAARGRSGGERLAVEGVTMDRDWRAYQGYFDTSLTPAPRRMPPRPQPKPRPRKRARG